MKPPWPPSLHYFFIFRSASMALRRPLVPPSYSRATDREGRVGRKGGREGRRGKGKKNPKNKKTKLIQERQGQRSSRRRREAVWPAFSHTRTHANKS